MAKIVGLGGVFFKSADPKDRKEWYAKHLGLHPGDGYEGVEMRWRRPDNNRQNMSLVSFFDPDTNYFGQGGQPFMLNFVVDDLDGMLTKLRADGCKVDDQVVSESYGKFGWLTDPDGVRIELWEPAGEAPDLPTS
ncbi:MAG: VOC family protein [Pseudomonadota bacterium]